MPFVKGKSGNAAGPKEVGLGNRRFSDYVTPEQKKEFIDWVFENYKKNSKLAVWVGDQTFGKAPQPVTGTGEHGEIVIKWST
jgi:hypothetical protein